MSLYKYGPKKFMLDLVRRGKICIGTLYYYKKLEDVDGVYDPLEGGYNRVVTDGSVLDIRERNKFLLGLFGKENSNIEIHFEKGTEISVELRSSNLLIYCTSYEKSKNVMKQFKGANSCVEITDPEAFFYLITQALNKEVSCIYDTYFPVSYGSYEREWTLTNKNSWSPAIVKTERFKPQKEVRAMWHPIGDVDKDFYLLSIPELTQYCRLINI